MTSSRKSPSCLMLTHQKTQLADIARVIRSISGTTSNPALARILGTHRSRFGQFMRGRATISQRTILRQNWDKKLAISFPKSWPLYASEFYAALALLRHSAGRKPLAVATPHPLVMALGSIMGHKSKSAFAATLGMSPSSLSRLLSGQAQPSFSRIEKCCWAAKLAAAYPAEWAAHAHAFRAAAVHLRDRRPSTTTRLALRLRVR